MKMIVKHSDRDRKSGAAQVPMKNPRLDPIFENYGRSSIQLFIPLLVVAAQQIVTLFDKKTRGNIQMQLARNDFKCR